MLCNNCGKNFANTYYKINLNGHTKEMYLCSKCASLKIQPTFTDNFFFSHEEKEDSFEKALNAAKEKAQSSVEVLKRELERAIKAENYEQAATLRDKIKRAQAEY